MKNKFLGFLLIGSSLSLVFVFQNCSKSHLVTEGSLASSVVEEVSNPLVKECVSLGPQKPSNFKGSSDPSEGGAAKLPPDLASVVLDSQSRLLAVVDNLCLDQNSGGQLRQIIFENQNLRRGLSQSAYELPLNRAYSFEELSDLAEEDPCVIRVDLNPQFQMFQAGPNDPKLADQVHLTKIEQPSIYEKLFNPNNGINSSVRVAVIDSGVDIYHPDLKDSLINDSTGKVIGYNGINETLDFADSGFHGTHVSGIIGATSGNGICGRGVLGQNLRLIPIKVSTDGTSVDLTAVINGIRWAADQGADVINMSLGGPTNRPTYREVLQYAIDKGAFVAVASGNDGKLLGSQVTTYPAMYSKDFEGMMTVGSIDASTQLRSSFSNYSTEFVDLMAPGSDGSNGILSTVPAAKSASLMASKISKSGISYPIHGTSMATPVVSGAAALVYALVRSRGYRPTPAQIEMALIKSAEVKTGLATFVKGGRNLNLKALVSFIDQDMGLSINSETSRNLAAGKVSIHAQPTDQTALVGGKVTFEVATTAESSVFLNYQWYKNGRPILDETKKQLLVKNISEESAATYHVALRAGSVEVISARAKLTVGKKACH